MKNAETGGPAGLEDLDMAVEPYADVKKYLDERAHETMYAIRARLNEILSFESEKNGR